MPQSGALSDGRLVHFLMAGYNRKQRTLLVKHKAHPVVIYCSGTSCEDAAMVADALGRLGFTNLHLFQGGWNEWTQAELPEEKNL